MMSPGIYDPAQWNEFFAMVGGGTAALAGLVFVAMSLNLEGVVRDATHRNRAVGTLSGFTAIFVLCGLALMGSQTNITIGLEWLVTAGLAGFVYVGGVVRATRGGGGQKGVSLSRALFGTACYAAQVAGAVLLMAGHLAGLYLAATALMLFFFALISGAWLLMVGICHEKGEEA